MKATSSLDSESEQLIQQGLAYLMQGRTTFVIAHRLSTIRKADQILVIEDGRVAERGTHETLYEARGRYFDLYTKQHGLESNLFWLRAKATRFQERKAAGRIMTTRFERRCGCCGGEGPPGVLSWRQTSLTD